MYTRLFLILSLGLLAACADMAETQTQSIFFETPGARNAYCDVYVDNIRYRVHPPQSTRITKSRKDLIVDCFAPGNKHKKEIFQSKISKYVYGDVVLPPALAWDYWSESLYKFPDIVTIDFTNTPIKPESLPAQNAPDIRQPEDYPMEEILPGVPRMNSDGDQIPFRLTPREKEKADTTGPDVKEMNQNDLNKVLNGLKKDGGSSASDKDGPEQGS